MTPVAHLKDNNHLFILLVRFLILLLLAVLLLVCRLVGVVACAPQEALGIEGSPCAGCVMDFPEELALDIYFSISLTLLLLELRPAGAQDATNARHHTTYGKTIESMV